MTHIITDHHFLIEALEMVTILTLKLRLSQLIIIMILILESHLVPMELLILLEWDLDKVHLLLPQGLLQALAEEDKVVLLVLTVVQVVVEEDKVVLEVVHYNQVVLVILLL